MAQFDVHRNTGVHKDSASFVVIVQSAQFDNYRRCAPNRTRRSLKTVPLVPNKNLSGQTPSAG